MMDSCECGYCVMCTAKRQKKYDKENPGRQRRPANFCSVPCPTPRTNIAATQSMGFVSEAPYPDSPQCHQNPASPPACAPSCPNAAQPAASQCLGTASPVCRPQQFFTAPMMMPSPQILPVVMPSPQCQPCSQPAAPPCKPKSRNCSEAPVEGPATTDVQCHHHHHEVTKKSYAYDKCSEQQQQPLCPGQIRTCGNCGGTGQEEERAEAVLPDGFSSRPSRVNAQMNRGDIMPPFEGFVASDSGGVADRIRAIVAKPERPVHVRPANFFVTGDDPANAIMENPGVLLQTYPGYISEFLLMFLLVFMGYSLWTLRR